MGYGDVNASYYRGVLTIEGQRFDVKEIGRGFFSKVYLTKKGKRVFAIISDDNPDYSKEILAQICDDTRSKHLPCVKKVGWTRNGTVYEMPFYKMPLRKADSETAWRQARTLKSCWEEALNEVRRNSRSHRVFLHSGYAVQEKTIDCAKAAKVPSALIRALELLNDYSANYGSSYTFEFPPRNLATDKKGNLVLIDVLFDMEAVDRERAKRAKRS